MNTAVVILICLSFVGSLARPGVRKPGTASKDEDLRKGRGDIFNSQTNHVILGVRNITENSAILDWNIPTNLNAPKIEISCILLMEESASPTSSDINKVRNHHVLEGMMQKLIENLEPASNYSCTLFATTVKSVNTQSPTWIKLIDPIKFSTKDPFVSGVTVPPKTFRAQYIEHTTKIMVGGGIPVVCLFGLCAGACFLYNRFRDYRHKKDHKNLQKYLKFKPKDLPEYIPMEIMDAGKNKREKLMQGAIKEATVTPISKNNGRNETLKTPAPEFDLAHNLCDKKQQSSRLSSRRSNSSFVRSNRSSTEYLSACSSKTPGRLSATSTSVESVYLTKGTTPAIYWNVNMNNYTDDIHLCNPISMHTTSEVRVDLQDCEYKCDAEAEMPKLNQPVLVQPQRNTTYL